MLCLNLSNIAIATVKIIDYHCIIHCISKSEAIDLLKNSVLEARVFIKIGILKKSILKMESLIIIFII